LKFVYFSLFQFYFNCAGSLTDLRPSLLMQKTVDYPYSTSQFGYVTVVTLQRSSVHRAFCAISKSTD